MGEVEFKEFKVGDLFDRKPSRYLGKGRKQDNVSKNKNKEFSLPLTNAKYDNNGVMYYGREEEWDNYAGVLTLVYDGAVSAGMVYAHKDRVGTYSHSYPLKVKEHYGGTHSFRVYQYLATTLEKVTYAEYSREFLATWGGKVENNNIKIPVKPDGTPDFEYMENYIKEIEQKYISNLKQKLETDKTNLLKVIGKKEEDLEKVIEEGFTEETDYGYFKIGGMFEPILAKGKGVDKKEKGKYPLVCGSGENNGLDGFTDREDLSVYHDEITMSTRGSSGSTFYQKGEFVLNNNAMVLKSKVGNNRRVMLYIVSVMNNLGYRGYDSYPTKSGIVEKEIKLPIIEDGQPDFQYMERYISYIELAHTHNFIETERKRIELIEELVHKEDKGEQSGRK